MACSGCAEVLAALKMPSASPKTSELGGSAVAPCAIKPATKKAARQISIEFEG